jgi:hypothetical protein
MANLDSSTFLGRGKIKVGEDELVLRSADVHALRGKVFYDPASRYLSVRIQTRKDPSNNGPAHVYTEGAEWPQGGRDIKAMKAYLKAVLNKASQELTAKTWPEQKDWIVKCNSGNPTAEFRAASCASCTARYCTYPR